jgi:hypothetical protein
VRSLKIALPHWSDFDRSHTYFRKKCLVGIPFFEQASAKGFDLESLDRAITKVKGYRGLKPARLLCVSRVGNSMNSG